jgi:hypothetical protein
MPIRYGHYLTAFRRLKRWQREGVWSSILEILVSRVYSMGRLRLGLVAFVDGCLLNGSALIACRR